MRRTLLALTIVASALLIAACSSASPGWTYAPPTEPPASQPAPSGEATVAPEPTPVESAAPSGGAGDGDVVDISALNIAWEQTEVSAPAGKPFTIHFNNKDAGIPHNVAIKDAAGMEMFKGDIITGPMETDYKVPALAAGTYQFICTVHPNMIGTLTVGG